MDPLSISSAAVGLAAAALQASDSISSFIASVRSAKADLEALKGELVALQDVLAWAQESIVSNHNPITAQSGFQVERLMKNCHEVIGKIEALLAKQKSSRLGETVKWTVSGKEEARRLRLELEAHRDALSIAVQLVCL